MSLPAKFSFTGVHGHDEAWLLKDHTAELVDNIKRPWRKELDCWKRAFFHLMRTHRAGHECRIGAAVFVDMPMPKFSIKVDYDKDELVFVVEKE